MCPEWMQNNRRLLLSRNFNVLEVERCLVFKNSRNQRCPCTIDTWYLHLPIINQTYWLYFVIFLGLGDLDLMFQTNNNVCYFLDILGVFITFKMVYHFKLFFRIRLIWKQINIRMTFKWSQTWTRKRSCLADRSA